MRWPISNLFCALLTGILFAAPAAAEPRLALVIANGAYSGGMDPLANPVNDGKLIAGTLMKLGFEVTLVEDADQKRMKRAVADFGEALETVGPTASALFYYAGHGLQVDGQNYLVPVGADIRREADVDLEAVSAEAVLRQMEYAAPSTSVVILDACRNNPLSRGFRSAARGLARMDAPNGYYVAYSTALGQTAADGTGRNSPFAVALATEMVKPGQGIEEVFRNVRVNVAKATGGAQTPWDSSSLMSSFYFAGEKQVVAVAAPSPEPAPAPLPAPAAAAPSLDAAESAFWNSIKDSNRAGDYAAYLKKYPSGAFAELAQSRREELEAQQASRAAAVPAPVSVAPAAAAPAAIEPEEEFESPLADGTIVLSRKSAEALKTYLKKVRNRNLNPGVNGLAYFAVSPDGRQTGEAHCKSNFAGNDPTIPTCMRGSARKSMQEMALKNCAAQVSTECQLLFYGSNEMKAYKFLD